MLPYRIVSFLLTAHNPLTMTSWRSSPKRRAAQCRSSAELQMNDASTGFVKLQQRVSFFYILRFLHRRRTKRLESTPKIPSVKLPCPTFLSCPTFNLAKRHRAERQFWKCGPGRKTMLKAVCRCRARREEMVLVDCRWLIHEGGDELF